MLVISKDAVEVDGGGEGGEREGGREGGRGGGRGGWRVLLPEGLIALKLESIGLFDLGVGGNHLVLYGNPDFSTGRGSWSFFCKEQSRAE